MDFLPIFYIFIQFFLLTTFWLIPALIKPYWYNVLVTLNIMLCVYSIYLARILIGLVQFLRPFMKEGTIDSYASSSYTEQLLRLAGMVVFPFLFLIPLVRKNIAFTVLICMYFIWNYTPNNWYFLEMVLRVIFCLSFFATSFAVLWLFKKLPSQLATN